MTAVRRLVIVLACMSLAGCGGGSDVPPPPKVIDIDDGSGSINQVLNTCLDDDGDPVECPGSTITVTPTP